LSLQLPLNLRRNIFHLIHILFILLV
jgi:hypothetical protein